MYSQIKDSTVKLKSVIFYSLKVKSSSSIIFTFSVYVGASNICLGRGNSLPATIPLGATERKSQGQPER